MSDEQQVPRRDGGHEELENLLATVGMDIFPLAIQQEVDALLDSGQSLEPPARQRLIKAAQRGTRQWALRSQAALETLLFEARRDAGTDAEVVAEIVGLDAETIMSIERGDSTIDAQAPRDVAAWALALGMDRPLLADALRRSLAPRGTAVAYAGERQANLDSQQQRFLLDVLQAFDERGDAAG